MVFSSVRRAPIVVGTVALWLRLLAVMAVVFMLLGLASNYNIVIVEAIMREREFTTEIGVPYSQTRRESITNHKLKSIQAVRSQ